MKAKKMAIWRGVISNGGVKMTQWRNGNIRNGEENES